MANQKLSQVQIDGVEYDIGLKSLELGTSQDGDKNIQQVADGVAEGLPFQGENTYAESIDVTLKDVQPYGAVGKFSAAFGGKSSAQGKRSFANGTTTIAKGDYSHAEGNNSVALGAQSHAEGTQTVAVGLAAHSEGLQTRAIGEYSHAEGIDTLAEGYCSHTEGTQTVASGEYAHATGNNTKALGPASHVEGTFNITRAAHSHAEGLRTVTVGNASHAEGNGGEEELSNAIKEVIDSGDVAQIASTWNRNKNFSAAVGLGTHVEGISTMASGVGAHAEGKQTGAWANYSHAGGLGTKATAEAQTVIGKYNVEDSNALFIVGSGEDAKNPSNALSVYSTYSKVGKALSGDQPCLRNIRYGTKSPDTAVEFIADNTLEGIVKTYSNTPDDFLLEAMTFGGYCNKLYQKALNNCSGTIVIEVSANTDDILIPKLDRSTVSNSSYGPRIFLTPSLLPSGTGYLESVYGIKTAGNTSPEMVSNFIWSSAVQTSGNKIYIDIDALKDDLSSLNMENLLYIGFQFCDSATYAGAIETHTLGVPLIATEGELYLRIEE